MKKTAFLTAQCAASLALIYLFHRYDIVLKEWTPLSLCVPCVYAGVHFKGAGGITTMFTLLFCLSPLLVVAYSENARLGVNMLSAALTTGFVSLFLADVIRKDAKTGSEMVRIQDILSEMRAYADEASLLQTMKRLFRESSGFEEAEVYLFGEDGALRRSADAASPALPAEHLYYRVASDGVFFASDSAADDPRLRPLGSGAEENFAVQLAAFPINYGGRPRGVVAISSDREERLDAETVNFLLSLQQTFEAALEITEKRANTIMHEIRHEKIKDTFSSYVTKTLADEILNNPEGMGLTGKTVDATVLFAQIANFKELLAESGPDVLFSMLNEYFSRCVEIVLEEDGIIDKFIGEKLMACWGVPLPVGGAEEKAVCCARKLLDAADALNTKWRGPGRKGFEVSVGVNSGRAIAGNIGSARRMEYTVIGDSVNTAARINSLAASMKEPLLVSEAVFNKINRGGAAGGNSFRAELKGKNEDVTLYRL